MRLRAVLIAGLAVGTTTVWSAPVAQAACHSFVVSASSPVTEGAAVNVTVTRDAGVADSHVTVSTVDGSATAGSDYTGSTRTVSFTGSGTSQSFSILTTNDSAVEAAETFKLHLSDPGGCAPNPNFALGPDATVTINDNDVVPITTATTAVKATTTLKATTTTTLPTTTTSSSSTTSSTTTTTLAEDDSDDKNNNVALLAGALVLVGLAATGVAIALRRRSGGVP